MRRDIIGIIAAALLCCLLFPAFDLLAIADIEVSLLADKEEVRKGDIVSVSVRVNRLPHIINFNDIPVLYDDVSLNYMSCTISDNVSEYFAITAEEVSAGTLMISGSDENAENAANEHKVAEDEEFSDISFDSDEPVILCTLNFRVKVGAFETTSVTLGEDGTFTNSSFESIKTVGKGNAAWTVSSEPSNDPRLLWIKVNGTPIADFRPDINEYYVKVDKDVDKAVVEAEAFNSLSEVVIPEQDLVFGDNGISIAVTAPDKVSSTTYKVTVTRENSLSDGGESFIDNRGSVFSLMVPPDDVKIPDGFYPSVIDINDMSVPCYVHDGVYPVLVYVFDGASNNFYFYYPNFNRTVKYDPDNTFVRQSAVFTVREVPPYITIPQDFTPAVFKYNGKELTGYTNSSGDIICYLESETGISKFYRYDYENNFFSEYRPVDDRPEKVYRFLFHMILIIAIAEACAIILIVYVVRKFRKERVNPRPRRV